MANHVRDLYSDVQQLEALDRIRERCEELRDEARRALDQFARLPLDAKSEEWDTDLDLDERGLLIKALCRPGFSSASFAAHLGRLRQYDEATILGDPAILNVFWEAKYRDDVPESAKSGGAPSAPRFLEAALALGALSTAPQGVFNPATMLFYYVVIRELYQAAPPVWTVGGARGGAEGIPTAFVTGEMVRAVLCFARMLRRTSAYFNALAELQLTTHTNIPEWNRQDVLRRGLSLYTTLAQRSFNLAFPLAEKDVAPEKFDDASIEKFETEIQQKLIASIQSSDVAFTAACNAVEAFRKKEIAAAGTDVVKVKLLERSHTPHAIAFRALNDSVSRASRAKQIMPGAPKVGRMTPAERTEFAGQLDALRDVFEEAADGVMRLIEPAIAFMSSVLDRELTAATRGGGSIEASEMASAAACLGAARGSWTDERLSDAAKVLGEVLSPNGFAIGQPYHAAGGSYYQPRQAAVIAAYAQLLEHADVDLPETTMARIVAYFESTKRPIDKDKSSWRWEYSSRGERRHNVYHTTLAALALDRLCRMLDARINAGVFRHFAPKASGKLTLQRLFYPDYGLAELQPERQSIAVTLERMRAHVVRVPLKDQYAERLYSTVLHGPPGTGKTTLIEALAATAEVPLIEVTPGDIVVDGEDRMEARARAVLRALSLLTRTVVMFDEFEQALRSREAQKNLQPSVLLFLTSSMLPKLKALYERAKTRHVAYAMITNELRELDEAAIRSGRFDAQVGVYPPDALSRFGRLWTEVEIYVRENSDVKLPPDINARFEQVIKAARRASMQEIGKPGWFSRPNKGQAPRSGTIFGYLFGIGPLPKMDQVERMTKELLHSREQSDVELLDSTEASGKDFRGPLWLQIERAF